MTEEIVPKVIHKVIQPIPNKARLIDIVLCWTEYGPSPVEEIQNTALAKSINDVNCRECWEVWIKRAGKLVSQDVETNDHVFLAEPMLKVDTEKPKEG
jgi:hypothetical protein